MTAAEFHAALPAPLRVALSESWDNLQAAHLVASADEVLVLSLVPGSSGFLVTAVPPAAAVALTTRWGEPSLRALLERRPPPGTRRLVADLGPRGRYLVALPVTPAASPSRPQALERPAPRPADGDAFLGALRAPEGT